MLDQTLFVSLGETTINLHLTPHTSSHLARNDVWGCLETLLYFMLFYKNKKRLNALRLSHLPEFSSLTLTATLSLPDGPDPVLPVQQALVL